MKRTARVLAATVGIAAVITGTAAAASSPTVSTRPPLAVGQTSAALRAAVNPNGSDTSYVFQYGVTGAYGTQTASHRVGHGTKAVAVTLTVGGLTPGTIYHYRVVALSAAGVTFGGDRAFTTTGHPLASVVTGAAVNVGKSIATPTGSVNPEGAPTTWAVQYGLTPLYGAQTIPAQALAAVTTPLPVSIELSGLAPGKLFHYRVIAAHGPFVSAGADQTFFTEPSFRRTPRISSRTTPSRLKRKPYVFTTSGTLHGAGFIPETLRCTGEVGVRVYAGKRQVNVAVAPVQPNCSFSTPIRFRKLVGNTRTALRVAIHFRGNGYLKPADRTAHVTLG